MWKLVLTNNDCFVVALDDKPLHKTDILRCYCHSKHVSQHGHVMC